MCTAIWMLTWRCLVVWCALVAAAITAVKNNIRWWDSLTDVEQSAGANIDTLVGVGESVINAEWSAWKSIVVGQVS